MEIKQLALLSVMLFASTGVADASDNNCAVDDAIR